MTSGRGQSVQSMNEKEYVKENMKSNREGGGRILALSLAIGAALGLMTGCGQVIEETPAVVKIDQAGGASSFVLTEAVIGDVQKTESIQLSFKQTVSETINFPLTGRSVAQVCVELGDTVKKGQLLAVLEGADCEDEIRDLEYRIARNNLLLEYVDINEANALSNRWWRYTYQSSGSDAETEKLEADLKELRQSYRYQREDLQDTISLDEIQLENYRQEMEAGRIYATMDGVISKVAGGMENRVSSVSDMAFMIIDENSCLFESGKVQYADYFTEGEVYSLQVKTARESAVYEVVPWNKEQWEKKIYFSLAHEEDMENVSVGTSGTILLVLDSRTEVLTVPRGAVYAIGDKSCVYVLGENDIREVRWVETGLYGDTLVEITSGLEEGEAVILR